ncbi:rCG43648 [Rattus norvegicus]|uniref:RCG43648 n=1 Tax=Rattus norvegicus TaxID=10116 RepID=A6JJ45_RAT|nr:rCG43648 [Rattus norvegicus]
MLLLIWFYHCMCAWCLQTQAKAEEGVRSSGTAVKESCEQATIWRTLKCW